MRYPVTVAPDSGAVQETLILASSTTSAASPVEALAAAEKIHYIKSCADAKYFSR